MVAGLLEPVHWFLPLDFLSPGVEKILPPRLPFLSFPARYLPALFTPRCNLATMRSGSMLASAALAPILATGDLSKVGRLLCVQVLY